MTTPKDYFTPPRPRRWILPVALLAGTVLTWLAFARPWRGATGGPDAVLIGVLAPFGTPIGDGIRNGVRMAVDEVNAAGGVAGRPFRVVEVDTGHSVERSVAGYQQLAGRDGAVAVIGAAGEGVFAVMEQLQQFGVPLLGTAVAADRLTEMVQKDPTRYGGFFRVMHSSSELADATADFAAEKLFRKEGLFRFGIMVENAAWTDAIRQRWESTIRGTPGMELAHADTFSSETKDFRPLLSRMRSSGVQYILDASSRVEATQYLRQWAAMHGPAIGAIPTGAGTEKYFKEVGPDGISVCSVATIPSEINESTPRSADWWRRYRGSFGDPEYTSAYSYDAVLIVKEAIERSLQQGGSFVKALEATDHAGVAARWVFGPGHHPRYGEGYREIPILQYYRDDPRGFRLVWPEHRAQGSFILPPWSTDTPSGSPAPISEGG